MKTISYLKKVLLALVMFGLVFMISGCNSPESTNATEENDYGEHYYTCEENNALFYRFLRKEFDATKTYPDADTPTWNDLVFMKDDKEIFTGMVFETPQGEFYISTGDEDGFYDMIPVGKDIKIVTTPGYDDIFGIEGTYIYQNKAK